MRVLPRIAIALPLAGWLAFFSGCHKSNPPATVAAHAPVAAAAPVVPAPVVATVAFPPHATFVSAATSLGLDPAVAEQLPSEVRPVFNLGRIQAGHTLIYTHTASGAPLALTYQIEANRLLRLTPGVPNWTAAIETTPYVTHLVSVAGTVQSSLFGAVEAAGEHDQLALELASIFGWDLDFYTDPRQGDTFRVLVDENFLNGKFSGYGQVVAAEYVNAGSVFDALRFHDAFGQLAYYRPDGHPMKKAFLRSPLKFAAPITSGFSQHRFHPILKTYRAHLGTDFGAPIGTPVQTIGSGTVTRAGRFGGDGNMVQIQHTGGYQTLYLHLSRILVHVGERVAQGERIGLVGMTGLATGPHLDFRIEHNGTFENFEVVRKRLPPAEPVAASLMPQFSALRAELLPKLHALP